MSQEPLPLGDWEFPPKGYWRPHSGELIRLRDMESSHLFGVLATLKRWEERGYKEEVVRKIGEIRRELSRRSRPPRDSLIAKAVDEQLDREWEAAMERDGS